MPKRRTPLLERLMAKVCPEPNTGCWLWTGASLRHGYGEMSVPGDGVWKVTRVSWELHRGPIPEGLDVCHRCDTPACVNPDHLFLGTHQDNMDDMAAKGRRAMGGKAVVPKAGIGHVARKKLTDDEIRDVRYLLANGMGRVPTAKRFGVSKHAINLIAWGRTHKDVR